LKNYLNLFPLINIEKNDYIKAAELYNEFMSKGIAASTTDCLISSVCIRNNCVLLASDEDFKYIAKYSKLELLKSY